MYIVILLAIGLALAYLTRPQDRKSYHKAVLAIFGIAYFCIWRFADYYFDIFPLDPIYRNVAFTGLMLISIGSGLLPWVLRIKQISSLFLVAIFAVCVLITLGFETTIKNAIAVKGGFFDGTLPKLTNYSASDKIQNFQYSTGGYSVNIPDTWQEKKNDLEMVYFIHMEGKDKTVEFRPGCFHKADKPLSKIITDMVVVENLKGMDAEKVCTTTEKFYICSIRSWGEEAGEKERWRWAVMDKQHRQNMELDFVFYTNSENDRRSVEKIIGSFQFIPLPDPLPFCPRSAEWF